MSKVSFIAALLLAVFVVGLVPAAEAQERPGVTRPRNVILFISDGMGPASITMARDYLRDVRGGGSLALDGIQVGAVHTYASDNRVTDSAAGATAYSAGIKTYNGAIGVDAEGRPVGTLLEAAEDRGMATGLVATTRITHATPASFAAHVSHRDEENEIARQMVSKGVDVIFGGGRRHFVAAGGAREDGLDLVAQAREAGYNVVENKEGLLAAQQTPVFGLVVHDQLAFEIDRDESAEPSLAEMTRKAIELLNGDPEGFFLMIEGSRIDHAAHANDPAAHLFDVLAFDEAVAAALEFARRDGETLVVSSSDHETGGLTLGRAGAYRWNPEVLGDVTGSLDVIVPAIQAEPASAEEILRRYTHFSALAEDERDALDEAGADRAALRAAVSGIISERAGVVWTTTGHTAVDVNLYAFGPGRDRFVGSVENTYVGRTLADLMQVDLDAATAALRRAQGSE